MNRLNRVIGITIAVLISAVVMQTTAYAEIGANPQTHARHNRIVGLWDVNVRVTNCNTGATIATFKALHKYELGGTGQVVPNSNGAGLSAHMMIWSHDKRDDYLMAIKMFRWDAAGNNIGWVVLNNEISINQDADEYWGSGVSQTYDKDGNLVGGGCPVFEGTRFTG